MNRAALLLLVLGAFLRPALAADFQPVPLSLGSPAPDFQLPGVDDQTHSLKEYAAAKVLVVIFTCNHCPSAQYYEERIKALVTDYTPQGVAVVAIMPNDPKSVRLDELGYTDLGDTFPEMKFRARDRQFNFPYLYDGETESVAHAYGPVATPHVFIFDAARKLRYQGAFDDAERIKNVKQRYAREVIDALLAGREPAVTKTKIVGCSVKWAAKEESARAHVEILAAEPVTVQLADAERLKALRKNDSGKFRLINFWATWCAPCVAEFPEFVTINRMYRQRDFELITVALNDPDEQKQVLAFLQKRQSSGENLLFASENRDKLIDAFDPDWQGQIPYTILLSPDGKVLFRQFDRIDPLALKPVIVKALNEQKPW